VAAVAAEAGGSGMHAEALGAGAAELSACGKAVVQAARRSAASSTRTAPSAAPLMTMYREWPYDALGAIMSVVWLFNDF
jgi:hypothetical protein